MYWDVRSYLTDRKNFQVKWCRLFIETSLTTSLSIAKYHEAALPYLFLLSGLFEGIDGKLTCTTYCLLYIADKIQIEFEDRRS